MEKKLLKKLNNWHDNNEFERIIIRILEIPENERDYDLISHLARAYNNNDNFDEAIEQLFLIKDEGLNDPLWHHRLGYAYFYLNNYKNALKEFEKAYNLDENDPLIEYFLNMTKIQIFIEKNYLEEIDT